jgi:membrane protease YdiL (CAAX protease family)
MTNAGLRWLCGLSSALTAFWGDHALGVQAGLMLFRSASWLLITYLVVRPSALSFFLRDLGLTQRPTIIGWLLCWGAIGLALLDLLLAPSEGGPTQSRAAFFRRGGIGAWSSHTLYLVFISPFTEEVVMRGFLYPAFRQRLGVLLSIGCVLCVALFFHWRLVTEDMSAFWLFILGFTTLCCIREHTGSTWHCVMFHAVYNAAVLGQFCFCILTMALLVPLCARRPVAPAGKASRG